MHTASPARHPAATVAKCAGWLATAVLSPSSTVWAGMPSMDLSDLAAARFRVISFFCLGIVISAVVLRWVWNGLRPEWPALPQLSFRRALGLTILWGTLCLLVLTMISGARELMTPGAWRKEGLTYRLTESAPPSDFALEELQSQLQRERRRRGLEYLARALERFAAQHGGRYPEPGQVDQIAAELWSLPNLGRARYVYRAGHSVKDGRQPIAYEPDVVSPPQFVLFADGEIEEQPLEITLREVEASP